MMLSSNKQKIILSYSYSTGKKGFFNNFFTFKQYFFFQNERVDEVLYNKKFSIKKVVLMYQTLQYGRIDCKNFRSPKTFAFRTFIFRNFKFLNE